MKTKEPPFNNARQGFPLKGVNCKIITVLGEKMHAKYDGERFVEFTNGPEPKIIEIKEVAAWRPI